MQPSSKFIYLKWDYFIKNNKPRPYRMLLFGKRGTMQCGFSERR